MLIVCVCVCVCVCACVCGGRRLARVRLIGLFGWVGLHTCRTLSNQCAQVKPAITTNTQGEISCLATWSVMSCFIVYKLLQYTLFLTPPHCPCLEEPSKSHLCGVWNEHCYIYSIILFTTYVWPSLS